MKPLLCLLLPALTGLCVLGAVLRSPKDAANQPRKESNRNLIGLSTSNATSISFRDRPFYAGQPLPYRATNGDRTVSIFDHAWYGDRSKIWEYVFGDPKFGGSLLEIRTDRVSPLIPPAVVPRALTNRVPVKPITNVSLIWDWYPTSGPVSFNVWHTTNLRQWDLIKSNVAASPVKLPVQPGAHYFRVSSYRP